MKSSIASKLEQLVRRLGELTRLLSSEDVVRDMDSYRKLTREHAEITPVVELYQSFKQAEEDAHTAQGMLADPQMKAFAEVEIREARERMAAIEVELQKLLLPEDPNDERNTFLEIRAGTGGDESALFAGDLFRMYTRFAERNRWQVEVISESASEVGGFKEMIAKIIGQGVFSKLKFESGGHRSLNSAKCLRVKIASGHRGIHVSIQRIERNINRADSGDPQRRRHCQAWLNFAGP